MTSYVKRVLQPDEGLLYQAQIHWVIYLDGLFYILLGALLGSFGPHLVQMLLGDSMLDFARLPLKFFSLAIVAYGALDLVLSYIRQISTELVITNQRVIAKTGLVATTSYELMIGKVEGATIDQSALGRIMGYGTLMVKGTGGGISPIDPIADPTGFHRQLMHAIREQHETPPAPKLGVDLVSEP